MAFTENSSAFINDGTPGYIRAPVGGVQVDALLIESPANDFSVGGFQTELHCIPQQVTAAARGTAVVVGSVNYKVRETPDVSDPGVTVLLLEKA